MIRPSFSKTLQKILTLWKNPLPALEEQDWEFKEVPFDLEKFCFSNDDELETLKSRLLKQHRLLIDTQLETAIALTKARIAFGSENEMITAILAAQHHLEKMKTRLSDYLTGNLRDT